MLAGRAAAGAGDHARRRRRDQVHHHRGRRRQRRGDECRQVAYAIAHSPLVKTAFFASDPNLGRILAAVGYAGIDDLDQTRIDLYLDDVHVAKQGRPQSGLPRSRRPARDEAERDHGARRAGPRRRAADTVWTCDLSPRLRDHQRRLPFVSTRMTQFEQFLIARAEQLLARIESVLPPAAAARPTGTPPSPAATAGAAAATATLQPVRHVAPCALSDLKDIDAQKEKIERNTRQFVAGQAGQQRAADRRARHRQVVADQGLPERLCAAGPAPDRGRQGRPGRPARHRRRGGRRGPRSSSSSATT